MGVPAGDLVIMLMADYGVNLYGNALFVNPKFAADKPEAVRGFLLALVKGIKDTVTDPDAAVDIGRKRNDVSSKPVELVRLRIAVQHNILTPEGNADGY